MKKAYVTVLSSNDFYKGVKALYKGLRRYSQEEFCALVSDKVSSDVSKGLEEMGIKVIPEKDFSEETDCLSEEQKNDRWAGTLFKLHIFKNHGYDKIVYLDSDLLIRDSLDELFDKPSISAVSDKSFFGSYGRGGLNAGVMVIEPNDELFESLVKAIPAVAEQKAAFGDQDVINRYCSEWDKESELHLDAGYNTCFYDSEKADNPKVVHFILASKPWMWNKRNILLKEIKWLLTGKKKQIKYLREYLGILED